MSEATAFVPPLLVMGKAVSAAIAQIPSIYGDVTAEPFGIMPDHFHMILNIFPDENGLPQPAPSVSRVVEQLKRAISLRIGQSIWQRSYYEHIVRNELDYQEIRKYIEENPIRWILKRQVNRA
ncbi:MAG: hypothetical protein GX540_06430 [Clostridiales bacterium]|nr:hypothetical protein [Clostridiales bacterium]